MICTYIERFNKKNVFNVKLYSEIPPLQYFNNNGEPSLAYSSSEKAVGPDNINHKMLKRTVLTIAKPLCLLFNRSLSDCTFPCSWKIASVFPLYKKDDSSCVSNYRLFFSLKLCVQNNGTNYFQTCLQLSL